MRQLVPYQGHSVQTHLQVLHLVMLDESRLVGKLLTCASCWCPGVTWTVSINSAPKVGGREDISLLYTHYPATHTAHAVWTACSPQPA
eukprot:140588-Chlamydomonas_euryale.AAC.1